MKNTNRLLTVFVLAVTLLVTISSCKKEDAAQPTTTTTTTPSSSTPAPVVAKWYVGYHYDSPTGFKHGVTKCLSDAEVAEGEQLYGWYEISKGGRCN